MGSRLVMTEPCESLHSLYTTPCVYVYGDAATTATRRRTIVTKAIDHISKHSSSSHPRVITRQTVSPWTRATRLTSNETIIMNKVVRQSADTGVPLPRTLRQCSLLIQPGLSREAVITWARMLLRQPHWRLSVWNLCVMCQDACLHTPQSRLLCLPSTTTPFTRHSTQTYVTGISNSPRTPIILLTILPASVYLLLAGGQWFSGHHANH